MRDDRYDWLIAMLFAVALIVLVWWLSQHLAWVP